MKAAAPTFRAVRTMSFSFSSGQPGQRGETVTRRLLDIEVTEGSVASTSILQRRGRPVRGPRQRDDKRPHSDAGRPRHPRSPRHRVGRVGGGLEAARRLRQPVAGACLAGACHAAPRGAPSTMGPVDTGPQSVEATRRQLEGARELVKLETYPAPGKVVPIEATGRMTFDAYGNVRTQGVVQGGGADAQRFLAYEEQVVIDPQKKEWRPGRGHARRETRPWQDCSPRSGSTRSACTSSSTTSSNCRSGMPRAK